MSELETTPWKKTFIFAFIAQIFSVVGFSFVIPFLPYFIEELGITDKADQTFWAGIVMSTAGITLAIFAPIWGILADKFGRRSMLIRAGVGGTIVLYLMSYVQSVQWLVVCRLLQGMFTGTVAASVALVSSVTPPKRKGLTLGMMQTAVLIGFAMGPLIGGVAADAWGYRVTFRIGSGIILFSMLFVLFGTSEPSRRKTDGGKPPTPRTIRQIISSHGFLAAVIVLFSIRFSNTISNPSFPLIIKEIAVNTLRLNSLTGTIIFVVALSGALSAAVLGVFGDKWGHKKILIVCSCSTAVLSFVHIFIHTIPVLIVVRALFGLSVAGMIPAANVIIHKSLPEDSIGKGYGIASSLSMVGLALGPFIGGWAGREFGLRAPFGITAACQLAVMIMIIFAIKSSNISEEDITTNGHRIADSQTGKATKGCPKGSQ